jgi:hypothetical protein
VAVGGGVDDLVAGSANWTSYCSAALPLACVPYFGSLLSGAGFTLSYGSLVQWQNTTAMLVQQRPLISALQSCAQAPSGQGCDTPLLATTLALPACLPCYCLGLSQVSCLTLLSAAHVCFEARSAACMQWNAMSRPNYI